MDSFFFAAALQIFLTNKKILLTKALEFLEMSIKLSRWNLVFSLWVKKRKMLMKVEWEGWEKWNHLRRKREENMQGWGGRTFLDKLQTGIMFLSLIERR